jgi:glutamate N-acetyltransferase/amino-acid N-acetyltransferase
MGPVVVAERGEAAGDPESAEEAARYLAGEDVQITVDLGLGKGEATVWTCDLTEGYIKENAGLLS